MRKKLEEIEQKLQNLLLERIGHFVEQRKEATAKSELGKLTNPTKGAYDRFLIELRIWLQQATENDIMHRCLNIVDATLPHTGEVEIPVCDVGPVKWEIGDEKKPIMIPFYVRNTNRNIGLMNSIETSEGLRIVGLLRHETVDGIEDVCKLDAAPTDDDGQMEVNEQPGQAEQPGPEFIPRRPWYINTAVDVAPTRQGFEAFMRGLGIEANPYIDSTLEGLGMCAENWNVGYQQAKSMESDSEQDFVGLCINPVCTSPNSDLVAVESFYVFNNPEYATRCPFTDSADTVLLPEWIASIEMSPLEAFRQGWMTCELQEGLSVNPYHRDESNWDMWRAGFADHQGARIDLLYSNLANMIADMAKQDTMPESYDENEETETDANKQDADDMTVDDEVEI